MLTRPRLTPSSSTSAIAASSRRSTGGSGSVRSTRGNYVTASDSDGIVVVTQLDPISVIFTLAEDDLRRVMRRLATSARLPLAAYDRTGTEKLTTGVLETVDNEIDTSTGTVRLRATFENADGALFPNQFVNVSMLLDTLRGALTVPIAAVQTGRPGTYVYRLNADDTVSLRKVSAGPSADGRTAVLSGLEAGDQMVVDGADHLADGARVRVPDEGAAPRKVAIGESAATPVER